MKLNEIKRLNESFLTDASEIHAWLNKHVKQWIPDDDDDEEYKDPMKGKYALTHEGKVDIWSIKVDLSENNLKELPVQFGKIQNGKDFIIMDNNLTSLKGCPELVTGSFDCRNNKLTSLEFMPKRIDEDFSIGRQGGSLKSLAGIHKLVDHIGGYVGVEEIESNMLGLLKIPSPPEMVYYTGTPGSNPKLEKACEIITKYLNKGKAGILSAQDELIDQDLEDFAEF